MCYESRTFNELFVNHKLRRIECSIDVGVKKRGTRIWVEFESVARGSNEMPLTEEAKTFRSRGKAGYDIQRNPSMKLAFVNAMNSVTLFLTSPSIALLSRKTDNLQGVVHSLVVPMSHGCRDTIPQQRIQNGHFNRQVD